MELQLKRPLVFFDLETTGISTTKDRIVEISYIKVYPDGREQSKTMRINPGMPIPPASTEVHHITDADVADCPRFEEVAESIHAIFSDSDLAGFNSNKFDVPMLLEEFARAGINFRVAEHRFIDVQNIFHKMEPRTLVAAYRFYCGQELENAHSAMADTRATYEVLKSQLDRYENLENDIARLEEFSRSGNAIDLSARIIRDSNGRAIFNFGKHKNKPVLEVFKREPSFYAWMMQSDFTRDTKNVITQLYYEVYPHKSGS